MAKPIFAPSDYGDDDDDYSDKPDCFDKQFIF